MTWAHAGAPRGLEHVERAADVGVHERLGGDVRVRDGDQGGEVEDGLDPLDRRLHEPRVPDVAEADLDLGAHGRFGLVEPARRPARVVEAEGAHPCALARRAARRGGCR